MSQPPADKTDPAQNKPAKPVLTDNLLETQHTLHYKGETLSYTATTGTLVLKDEAGEPKASVFFVAYTKNGVAHPSDRRLTFSFNGGPGSSSVWMHLGLLGPRRVALDDEGHPLPPPAKLVDNEFSLLPESDLVFIDPVSTGYSRPAPGEEAKQFHGVEQDVESVGEFIRLYVTRYQRWASPKFLIGESYGTTRAAALSGYLQNRHGMWLNGLMLISSILNFQTARFIPGNDLPYSLFLPTYTATAWYHQRLEPELQANLTKTLTEVSEFAATEYTLALMQGDSLSAKKRAALAQKLARYTGLTEAYLHQSNLRINIHRFVKELLRAEHRTVGRLDSRYTGLDRDSAGEHHEHDPSYTALQGAYTTALNDYVRRELGFESDLPYEILTSLYTKWDYSKHQNQYLNVAETLREAMTKNSHLRVFVANGYFDLATPYFATEYTFNHLGLAEDLRPNIEMRYYEAGHMMYVHRPSLAQLSQDLKAFVTDAG